MTRNKNCALCLSTDLKWLLEVFSESNKGFDMALIISKYLWFDLDPASEPHVCMNCWTTVHSFHRYYIKLETIHGDGADDGSTIDEAGSDNNMVELKQIEIIDENNAGAQYQVHEGEQELDEVESFRILEIEAKQNEDGTMHHSRDPFEDDKPPNKHGTVSCPSKMQIKTESNVEELTETGTGRPERRSTRTQKVKYFDDVERRNEETCSEMEESEQDSEFEPESEATSLDVSLERHTVRVDGEKNIKCNICHKVVDNKSYDTHKRTAHSMTNCKVCGKLISVHTLFAHMKRIHTDEDPLNCNRCGKMFRTTYHMKRHQKNTCKETMESRSSKCATGGEKEESKQNSEFEPESEATSGNVSLERHTDRVDGEKKIKCNICHKIVDNKSYDTHKRTAHRMTNCKVCGKFISVNTLFAHMKRIHSDEDPLDCNMCGRMFRTTYHMKRHQRKACKGTLDSRAFKCELCGKRFATKLTMIEHMTTHTGTNQYQCEFCLKSFGYSSNLYKHRKKTHPLEWKKMKERKWVIRGIPAKKVASVIVGK